MCVMIYYVTSQLLLEEDTMVLVLVHMICHIYEGEWGHVQDWTWGSLCSDYPMVPIKEDPPKSWGFE